MGVGDVELVAPVATIYLFGHKFGLMEELRRIDEDWTNLLGAIDKSLEKDSS